LAHYVVCVVLIRWKMGSPVIYRMQRPGKNGLPFMLYKFRTMNNNFMPDGMMCSDGDRLTPLGKLLRRWSLDELPQLWNVLHGDMSLVGPRPLRMDYLPCFTDREFLRHSVLPGITGWAQVNGRNHTGWDQRLAYDVWYVENWSLWLDIRIMMRTAFQVLRRDNVVVDPSSVMKNLNEERASMFNQAPQS
jgi:sugar transferase EpsL